MNQYILIKFGAREHMERLLNEGEVYMNPLAYFRENKKSITRHDPNEGIKRIMQMKGTVLKWRNPKNGKHETLAELTGGTGRIKSSVYDTGSSWFRRYCCNYSQRSRFCNSFKKSRFKAGVDPCAILS